MKYEEALYILQKRRGGLGSLAAVSPKVAAALDIAVEVLRKEVEKQCAAEDAQFEEIFGGDE